MSSLPGLDLEDFVAWYYRYSFRAGAFDAAFSVNLAEMLGARPERPPLTGSEFARVVRCFEPARESIETMLEMFDDEHQSWRDYSYGCREWAPDQCFAAAEAVISLVLREALQEVRDD